MAITDWPAAERPRERLLTHGPNSLSDAELLAIFLRTGLPGKSAVDLARELLQRFGSLGALLSANRKTFCQSPGLGDAKFAQLQAVLEMARRHFAENLTRETVLTSADTTRHFLQAQLRNERREVFAALYLDNQHQLLLYEPLFYGTVNGATVYPREVVKRALELNAAALIVAHNHPSGVAEPSRSDLAITSRLKQALEVVDIRLLDHCIVAGHAVVSLAERGEV